MKPRYVPPIYVQSRRTATKHIIYQRKSGKEYAETWCGRVLRVSNPGWDNSGRVICYTCLANRAKHFGKKVYQTPRLTRIYSDDRLRIARLIAEGLKR